MKIEFNGCYKSTIVEKDGLMLNTITVKRNDGEIVVLDRDETVYSFKDGDADIVFISTYEWDGNTEKYLGVEDITLYDGAEIVNYDVEDDADSEYDLVIAIGQKIDAW